MLINLIINFKLMRNDSLLNENLNKYDKKDFKIVFLSRNKHHQFIFDMNISLKAFTQRLKAYFEN